MKHESKRKGFFPPYFFLLSLLITLHVRIWVRSDCRDPFSYLVLISLLSVFFTSLLLVMKLWTQSPVATHLVAQENSWKYSSLKAKQDCFLYLVLRKDSCSKNSVLYGMGMISLKGWTRILSGKILGWGWFSKENPGPNHNCYYHLLSPKIFTEHLVWVLHCAGYYLKRALPLTIRWKSKLSIFRDDFAIQL